jgi:hypothetical protein
MSAVICVQVLKRVGPAAAANLGVGQEELGPIHDKMVEIEGQVGS